MRLLRTWLTAATSALFVLSGCASDVDTDRTSTAKVAPEARISEAQTIARFRVDVDPSAASVRFVRVREASKIINGIAQAEQALVSVLSNVTLTGPGTWHPDTSTLTATVRITNNDPVNNLDEPRLQIVSVTVDTVVFQGIHSGSGGVGSAYWFSDIEKVNGVDNGSAHQNMVIYDPGAKPFTFEVDVLANPTIPAI